MLICGVDVGKKNYYLAFLRENKLIKTEKVSIENLEVTDIPNAVGIDAPLSFPFKGKLRECERKLIENGILLFPSGANFFRDIVINGIKIAFYFKNLGSEIFEVYPYATRVLLNIAPNERKRTKFGKLKILSKLKNYIKIYETDINKLTHDELDAIISALTVYLFYKNKGVFIRGYDGEILIPKKKE